ncbi:unnamed protein product [Ilex paraguariensis]|uniref:IST1-like protein n=1 Tax=Ilex paraguariensis TaxID=185542 RepID=A0ABC8S3F2_9AQUA
MTVASAATSHCKKAIKFGLSVLGRGFNSSKCKTMAKMAVARIKLLRNKRQVVVRQMRRDIALLLESGQDATARVRVEHVIREQNIMAANEFIELFCELIVARLSIISKQRNCPADLKEGISSLIFAAPRCSDIPELVSIRDVFEKKYGEDFVCAATDLRPNCGVNRMLIDKLSVRTPAGEVKLKVMKEIAKEYQVEWDTTESEMELLTPPEELIEGPCTFVSASSMPVKATAKQSVEPNNQKTRLSNDGERKNMHFEDTTSAAEAAAECAKKAIAAAEAAAYLAGKGSYQVTQASGTCNCVTSYEFENSCGNSTSKFMPYTFQENHQILDDQSKVPRRIKRQSFGCDHSSNSDETMPTNMDARKICRRHSCNVPSARPDIQFDEADCDEEIEMDGPTSGVNLIPHQPSRIDAKKNYRRHSYNVPSAHSDIKFDESDCDDEIEMEEPINGMNLPPNRPAPQPVHPKLPDYDALAARFEALKYRKSQT